MTRAVAEPGGVLLVALGLSDEALQAEIEALYPTVSSLSVLLTPTQQTLPLKADEIWVYGPLGLRGFLALIRRISWRHFEAVYQPQPQALPYLKYLIWPRPPWRCASAARPDA